MSDAVAPDSMGLEVLFDLSPDFMCLATFDGYFRRVNPAFERTLGYTIEELTSRPFLDFVHPEDLERTRAVMKVMASGGELREFENPVHLPRRFHLLAAMEHPGPTGRGPCCRRGPGRDRQCGPEGAGGAAAGGDGGGTRRRANRRVERNCGRGGGLPER